MAKIATTARLVLRYFEMPDADRVGALTGNIDVSTGVMHASHPDTTDDACAAPDWLSIDETARAITRDSAVTDVMFSVRCDLGSISRCRSRNDTSSAARTLLAHHSKECGSAINPGALDAIERVRHVLENLGFVSTEAHQPANLSRRCDVLNHRITLTTDDWTGARP